MARRVGNLVVALAAAAAAKCEVLRSLEFQQHTAPKGVSELLGPVVSLVSEKAAEVGDIKIRCRSRGLRERVGLRRRHASNSHSRPRQAHNYIGPRDQRVPRDRGSCGDGRPLRKSGFRGLCDGDERARRRVTRLHIPP